MYPFDSIRDFERVRDIALQDVGAARMLVRLKTGGGGGQAQVRVYVGPPGTGKTIEAVRTAVALGIPEFDDEGDPSASFERFNERPAQFCFVTFHPGLQYEDMVESIRPVLFGLEETVYEPENGVAVSEEAEDVGGQAGPRTGTRSGEAGRDGALDAATSGQLRYGRFEGPLLRTIRNAIGEPEVEHVVVVDEINRGDLSRILGPLISGIDADKRIGGDYPIGFEAQYPLTESAESRIFLPSNFHVIGTMNSADRNIALVDYALRRRFDFVELAPDPSKLSGHSGEIDVERLLTTVNERIRYLLDRDHAIGHAYFMGLEEDAEVIRVVAQKVAPLMQEYFFGRERDALLVFGDHLSEVPTVLRLDRRDSFEGLFGMSMEEARSQGYSVHVGRVGLKVEERFWDMETIPPQCPDLEYGVAALQKVYESESVDGT